MTDTTSDSKNDTIEDTVKTEVLVKKNKRSKAGCFTCRLKRMKCDESRPVCGRCKRNIVNCIWPKERTGKLTKSMREIMKKKVDLYDEVNPGVIHSLLEYCSKGKRFSSGDELVFAPKEPKRVFQEVFKKTYFEHSEDTELQKLETPAFEIPFINYSYDKKQKDFVKLRSDKRPEQLGDMETDNSADCEFAERGDTLEDDEVTEVSMMVSSKQVSRYKVMGNGREKISSNPEFFWEKLFDINFYEPLMTPNFNIITPLPLHEELSIDSSYKPLLLTKGGDNDCYVLDDEQTGKIYTQLLERFKKWSKVNEDDKLLSVASLLSKYQFNDEELLLYYTCVHYFFPAIGPQPTLPQLTTTETFLPLLKQHEIVKDVFLCCGATFLEWCQPQKYTDVAEELYQRSQQKLRKETKNRSFKGDETWAFACFQLLCLTDKFRKGAGASMSDRCIDNLAHSFNIIKKKYRLIQKEGSTATDRMLIESFMYNYTVSLLVARDLSKLPSPFSKNFHELTKLLKSPLFDGCDVNWINNPILGSSVDAFEMLAKVSFLSRFPLPLKDNEWIERGKALLEECLYYTPPSLPNEVKNNPTKYATYRPSLLCGSIISKACYLLLSKILRFNEFQVRDFEIQGVVKYTIESLCAVEKGSPLLCILLWSLLIIGAFTIDPDDRLIIKEYLRSTSETIHSYGALKIANFLDLIWQQDNIDLLFVRDNICQVVI